MAVANGEKENEIIKTIQTNKIKVPLSVFNENDCKEQGITNEEMNILKNYAVPDDKKLLFSAAIFNLLKQKDLLETSKQGFYTKASGDNDYAPKSITSTVNTLSGASAGWNEVTAKLDKSIYSNASGNWENTYNTVNQ